MSMPLFSWSVVTEGGNPPHLGAVGVSDDRGRAVACLSQALRDAPAGAKGLVHTVTPSMAAVGFFYDDLVARAEIDPASGAVVWEEFPRRGSWGRFGDLLSAMARPAQDVLPPTDVGDAPATLDAETTCRRQCVPAGRSS